MKSFISFLFLLFFLGTTHAYSQEGVVSSGGDATGSGGTVAYSIGQVVYTVANGSGGSCGQGVQQPIIQNSTEIEELSNVLNCSLFPNPSDDFVTLDVRGEVEGEIIYMIFSVNGKLLRSEVISDKKITINIEDFTPSIYLVKVFQNNIPFKSIKFIKK